jgi:hypothetical protein
MKVLGSGYDSALINGASAFLKEVPRSLLVLSQIMTHQEGAINEKAGLHQILDLLVP